MIVIANVFPRLQIVKRFLDHSRRFRTSFGSLHVKGSQTLVKSAWEPFYHIFWSLWWEMTRKISPFLNFDILAVFVKTKTGDENYPFGDSADLQFPNQRQLS